MKNFPRLGAVGRGTDLFVCFFCAVAFFGAAFLLAFFLAISTSSFVAPAAHSSAGRAVHSLRSSAPSSEELDHRIALFGPPRAHSDKATRGPLSAPEGFLGGKPLVVRRGAAPLSLQPNNRDADRRLNLAALMPPRRDRHPLGRRPNRKVRGPRLLAKARDRARPPRGAICTLT